MSRRVLAAIVFVVVTVIMMNLVTAALFEANGSHARDHLASAQGPLPLIPLLAVVIWALPPDRRRVGVWGATLVIIVGAVVDVSGNLKVIDAIGGAQWNDAQAARLGSSHPGFEGGHSLADIGMRIIVAGAMAFALLLVAYRAVRPTVGIASAALTLVFPPWIAPGFGVIIIAVALLWAKNRHEHRATAEPFASSA